MSDLPALPDPDKLTPNDARRWASLVEQWAKSQDDLAELERKRQLVSDVEALLRRQPSLSAEIARADRRLEARIGQLLGPGRRGRPDPDISLASEISANQRHQFRLIAEHADAPAVAEAIERGASRSEVVRVARRIQRAVPKRVRSWSEEEQILRKRMEAGETVVVNIRGHQDLISWARSVDRYVRIDRQTPWGNPFVMPDDGNRLTVIDNYERHYLPYKPSLHAAAAELTGGKALGCWCAPEPCHGDVLAKAVNRC